MLRVAIELWPGGDRQNRREIGVAHIALEGLSADRSRGDYRVQIARARRNAKRLSRWRSGETRNFPRLRLNAWDLVYRALRDVVGERT